MIHGDGVLVKYCAILEARERELMENAHTPIDKQIATEYFMDFRDELRDMAPAEFNELYELYRDWCPLKTRIT